MAAAGAMFAVGALLSVCNNFVAAEPKEYAVIVGGASDGIEGEMTALR